MGPGEGPRHSAEINVFPTNNSKYSIFCMTIPWRRGWTARGSPGHAWDLPGAMAGNSRSPRDAPSDYSGTPQTQRTPPQDPQRTCRPLRAPQVPPPRYLQQHQLSRQTVPGQLNHNVVGVGDRCATWSRSRGRDVSQFRLAASAEGLSIYV